MILSVTRVLGRPKSESGGEEHGMVPDKLCPFAIDVSLETAVQFGTVSGMLRYYGDALMLPMLDLGV